MKDKEKQFDLASKFCKLLNISIIKKEIESHFEDYDLNSIERKNGEWVCILTNKNGGHILLTFSREQISLLKTTNNKGERITIDNALKLSHRIVEKRDNGIIYSVIRKEYVPSKRFNNEVVLADLMEDRYILTKDNMSLLSANLDDKYSYLLIKLRRLEDSDEFKNSVSYHNSFSTHMNYYYDFGGGRKVRDNIYPTRTYVNGDEVSDIFDMVDGSDKLYRVYDLYNGIINPRCENDIYAIHLGLFGKDSYNLKSLLGITKKEEELVGESREDKKEYTKYLRKLFDDKFGYKGDINLDRDSILKGITYTMTASELTKRNIERKIGIPYSQFEKLDLDEQHRLIEEKIGKKLEPDYRLRIDGIPMDEGHIMTIEDVDDRLEELTLNGPQKILKRIFRTFKRR